ncbi:MAG: hypothetical protein CSB55_00445 [Candidatus Cloacimonadota bacterium]|nr:MAG: hypothetical protein CSB55_00445 [Candidatus Cloacimonadota bacterium]
MKNKFFLLILLAVSFLFGEELPPKNSGKAAALSLFVPGAGQIYNESYIEAGIFIGSQSFFLGSLIYDHDRIRHYRKRRNKMLEVENFAKANEFNSDKKRFERRRDTILWWYGSFCVLSAIEAFVHAELYDFNQKRNDINLLFSFNAIGISYKF